MDDNTRTNIILAAVNAVPPVTEPLKNRDGEIIATEQEVWLAQVADKAKAIAVLTGAKSLVGHQLDVIEAAGDPENESAKIISGSILSITREESSTRGLVSIKTRVHPEYAPDGVEQARTERTDTAAGLMMATRIRNELIGHRVLLFIEQQPIKNSKKKARIIVHIEDLGLDESLNKAG